MTLHSLAEEKHDPENHWGIPRKVTIKELAAKLGVSVPTLRKYGECGLLGVDSVSGRTNLFDETAAVARVEEINRLKSRGYSLALIREKLEERPAGFMPLDLGLDGASFSRGRHALVIMADMDEYASFARKFIGNALRSNQAVMLVADPAERALYENVLREEGFDLDTAMKRRQVCFAWFEGKEHLDHHRQIEQYDALVQMIRNAGWQTVRILGQPGREGLCFDDNSVERYEERLTVWARALPVIVVCAWVAPKTAARELLRSQRVHREFVVGENVFMQP
jgi:DNA-binding transcriptional MerR regulator